MAAQHWNKGDNVVHSAKPEWGAGEILMAESTLHEGRPSQRLTIRFTRAGTKTISTAFASLEPASSQRRLAEAPSPAAQDERNQEGGNPEPDDHDPIAHAVMNAEVSDLMGKLPDAATDPFSSLKGRMKATLDLYRFTTDGGSLLDWAATQTGLKDPLGRFNRHELEQWFQKFRVELDTHLRKLVKEMRRQDPQGLAELTASAKPAAARAIRQADAFR